MLRALAARFVFPVTSPPIADGAVLIDGDRIVKVAPASRLKARCEVEDLGNVAILPGLVNAHTHLEFSDLEQPLGTPGMAFPDWIRAVIARRRARSDEVIAEARRRAIANGLAESLRAGVTTIGEIAPFHPASAGYSLTRQQVVIFREWLGLSDAHIDALEFEANEMLDDWQAFGGWSPGISPHAPYSTHRQLVRRLARIARAGFVPIAMHLAESREELELLQTHSGAFRALLDELGVWNDNALQRGARPLDYLRMLAAASRSLVIHGNYLDDEEIDFIAKRAKRMSIVYCPRTHDYFAHNAYPLSKMLAAGVNVALGTDSRASNPDLNLLAEMRHVARRHPVTFSDVVRMGTLCGARALGWDNEVGSLKRRRRANFAIVALPDHDSSDPHELLFDSDLPVVATYCGGVRVAP